MTLSKLSRRNARRQAGDYLVYFVTVILAAALVHAFNGLVFSQELRDLSDALEAMPLIIVLTSILVVCIIGWLVQYTIGFMLSRRSRELGTYVLIGLENRQVARLFFLENLAVGAVALVVGILLGNVLFQALRAVMLSLFGTAYTFSLAMSYRAVGLTVLYFALVYLLALFRSRKRIRTMNIHGLIYFERQNQGEVIKKARNRRGTFVVSIVLGIVGTLLLLMRTLPLGILGAFCVIAFLYGFFISFSSGVPAYFEKHAQRKYRGQTLLVFRSLSSKLATMGVVMATIALLLTATLISEGTGLLFSAMFESNARQTSSFDLFIGATGRDEGAFDAYRAYIDDNVPVRQGRQYAVYQGKNDHVTRFVEANSDYWRYFEYDTLMRESDYVALREMMGYEAVTLEPGQYLIHCMDYLRPILADYGQPLEVGGQTLSAGDVRTEVFTQSLWDGNGRGFILVVPDSAAAAQPVSHTIYAAMTAQPLPMDDYMALCAIRDQKQTPGYDTIFSKAAVEHQNASMYAMVVFPLFYLALVLTMVCATILTIQQLSETGRYRRQFALLHQLGMDRGEMLQALRRQFAIYYAMPAIPPLLISIPFLLALGGATDPGTLNGPGQLLGIVGTMLGLFFLIYLLYILMAYTSLRRNVLPPRLSF